VVLVRASKNDAAGGEAVTLTANYEGTCPVTQLLRRWIFVPRCSRGDSLFCPIDSPRQPLAEGSIPGDGINASQEEIGTLGSTPPLGYSFTSASEAASEWKHGCSPHPPQVRGGSHVLRQAWHLFTNNPPPRWGL